MIQLHKKNRAQYRAYLEQCKLEGAQIEVVFIHHCWIPNLQTFEANGRDAVKTTRAVQREHMKKHTDILCHAYMYPDRSIVPARSPFSNNCGCQYPPEFVSYDELPAGLRTVYEANTHGWGWRAWMNAYGFSLETCGNFDKGHEDPATSIALATTLDVAADVCEVWGLDPATRVYFHRDVTNWPEGKSCPGSAVEHEWVIEQILQRTQGLTVIVNGQEVPSHFCKLIDGRTYVMARPWAERMDPPMNVQWDDATKTARFTTTT